VSTGKLVYTTKKSLSSPNIDVMGFCHFAYRKEALYMDRETLRLVCNPDGEADLLTEYEHFGWILVDRKETFDSHEVYDGTFAISY